MFQIKMLNSLLWGYEVIPAIKFTYIPQFDSEGLKQVCQKEMCSLCVDPVPMLDNI